MPPQLELAVLQVDSYLELAAGKACWQGSSMEQGSTEGVCNLAALGGHGKLGEGIVSVVTEFGYALHSGEKRLRDVPRDVLRDAS